MSAPRSGPPAAVAPAFRERGLEERRGRRPLQHEGVATEQQQKGAPAILVARLEQVGEVRLEKPVARGRARRAYSRHTLPLVRMPNRMRPSERSYLDERADNAQPAWAHSHTVAEFKGPP